MIFKHKIYFFFWKILMRLIGIKPGTFYSVYSETKKRNIKGIVTNLSGNSINRAKFGFDIHIHWLEPIDGNDSRYFSSGSYSYKDIVKKLEKL